MNSLIFPKYDKQESWEYICCQCLVACVVTSWFLTVEALSLKNLFTKKINAFKLICFTKGLYSNNIHCLTWLIWLVFGTNQVTKFTNQVTKFQVTKFVWYIVSTWYYYFILCLVSRNLIDFGGILSTKNPKYHKSISNQMSAQITWNRCLPC